MHLPPDKRTQKLVPIEAIRSAALSLMDKAAIEIPEDYLDGLKQAAEIEDGDLSSFVLQAMLENYEAAKEDRRAMCGDTGCPRWYVKMGNEAQIEGGPAALEEALRRATADATNGVPLRPNRVHPTLAPPTTTTTSASTRRKSNMLSNLKAIGSISRLSIRAAFSAPTTACCFRLCVEGIKRFYLDSLIAFGKRGLACQPAIIGIGLGGSKDTCMVLGKRAACLRTVGDRNPDPKIADLEVGVQEGLAVLAEWSE